MLKCKKTKPVAPITVELGENSFNMFKTLLMVIADNGERNRETLEFIIKKLNKMAENQKELAAEMREVKNQLQKVGNESAKTLEKVTALEDQIKNLPNVDPELQTAFDELKAQVKVVDDMVPDAVEPGEDETEEPDEQV